MTQSPETPSIFAVRDLAQNRATPVHLRPAKPQLAEMAADLDLIELRKLSFSATIQAIGHSDWQLTGTLGATVVQPCVVTLAPVTTRIDVPVERRYLATMPDLGDDEEIEMPEDENAEALGHTIDVAQVMHEALALNLPLFPRAEGAELGDAVFTEPGKKAMTEEDARPFAGLAALRDKLGTQDDE